MPHAVPSLTNSWKTNSLHGRPRIPIHHALQPRMHTDPQSAQTFAQACDAANAALDCVCQRMGRSPEQLLLKSSATRPVLEYVGRHVADRPAMLRELSRLLQRPQMQMMESIAPHVIGWICQNQRRDCLQVRWWLRAIGPVWHAQGRFLFQNVTM